jgi:hypothetical protein
MVFLLSNSRFSGDDDVRGNVCANVCNRNLANVCKSHGNMSLPSNSPALTGVMGQDREKRI